MFKIPYYFYLVFWIISLSINKAFATPKSNLQALTALIILGIPLIILFIQILKNKNKIINFYKRIRFRFKHLFYTLESLLVVFFVGIIIGIINSSGYQNFKERSLYEYIFYKERNGYCARNYWAYMGDTEFSKYYWKANTQFLKYYEDKPDEFIKKIKALKNETLMDFNACVAIGHAIIAAHKGNPVAKKFLASMPLMMSWELYLQGMKFLRIFFLFEGNQDAKDAFNLRYINQLKEKDLYNPALLNAFGNKFLGESLKGRKYYKKAADEGYLVGMENYIFSFNKKDRLNKNECKDYLKYSQILSEENSLLIIAAEIHSNLGRLNYDKSYIIYHCKQKIIDYPKALNLMKEFSKDLKSKFGNYDAVYPGLIYYNGWEGVKQDKELALSLFKKNIENSKNINEISYAYLALDSFNNNDKKKARNYLKKIDEKKKVTDLVSLEKFIKKWIDDWFKNPELVKTLNIYG